jgi:hypothetical protein
LGNTIYVYISPVSVDIFTIHATCFRIGFNNKVGKSEQSHSVFDINKNYFAEESRNQVAGDMELIRSRILAKQALIKLPVDISYYAKGTVLDQEQYRSSPYNVQYVIKDSTVFGLPFYIEWIKQDQFNLSYTFNGS